MALDVFMLRFEGHVEPRTGVREETGLCQGGRQDVLGAQWNARVPSWTQSASG